MSQSLRFIAFALIGWVGLRAVSLGLIPGSEAIAFDRKAPTAAPLPLVASTTFAPIEPIAPPQPAAYPPGFAYAQPYPQPYPQPYAVPVYAPGLSPARMMPVGRSIAAPAMRTSWGPEEAVGFSLAPAAARYADSIAPLEQWPLAAIAGGPGGAQSRRAQSTPAELIRKIPGIDRLSMSAWATMRREPGSPSLATVGQLGGSQAGARLLWRFNPRLAASLRSSAPLGGVQRSAELAAGVRYQPLVRIPVAFTAERRQSFGPDKGLSAFALFAEGGVYDRPIVAGFNLDAYLQAGVVGIRDHAMFVDGSATLTRPVWRQFSAGLGVWGGAQTGLARLDAGPRASMRLGRSMRVHVDYRHRFVGKAAPGSGPVVTLAADF
jgi:hypothetical protein